MIQKRKYYLFGIVAIVLILGLEIPFTLNFSYLTRSPPPSSPIEWRRIWGGNDDEIMYEMVADTSGSFFIAGETWSYGNGSKDLFLLKMDENSTQYNLWGGPKTEEFGGLTLDSNENIYMAGSTSSYGLGESNAVLLKYNTSFLLEWDSILDKNDSYCREVAIDSFNNIYITGVTNYPFYDVFIVKYNTFGIQLWNRTWSTEGINITEEVTSFVIDSSDHIFLGVNTTVKGSEWFLLKYDISGTLLSNISYNKYFPIEFLVLDSLDNLYATGSYNNMYLTKFDNSGNVEWNLTCIRNFLDGTEVLAIDSFNNIFVAGNENISDSIIIHGYNISDYDTYIMKFDNLGNLKWNHTIMGDNNRFPEIIEFDSLGYIYLGGSLELIATKELDVFIQVIDPSGYRYFSTGGGGIGDAYCKGIYAQSLLEFIVAENSPTSESLDYDIILTKYIDPHNNDIFYYFDYQVFTLGLILLSTPCIIGLCYLIIKYKNKKRY
jgi:hypothetical protein